MENEEKRKKRKNIALIFAEAALGVVIVLLLIMEARYLMTGQELPKPEKAVVDWEDMKRINRSNADSQRVNGFLTDGDDLTIE